MNACQGVQPNWRRGFTMMAALGLGMLLGLAGVYYVGAVLTALPTAKVTK